MRERHQTRFGFAIHLLVLTALLCAPGYAAWQSAAGHGPEVRAFLELLRDEEEELEFQIRNREISRKDYLRARNRIAVWRQAVLSIVKKTGEDVVPELHVVTAGEADQIAEDGARIVKTLKPDAVVADKWRYIGSRTRGGDVFYIFERLPGT